MNCDESSLHGDETSCRGKLAPPVNEADSSSYLTLGSKARRIKGFQ